MPDVRGAPGLTFQVTYQNLPQEPKPREWISKNAYPRAIQCIVSWLYHGDYDDSKPSDDDIPDYSLKLGIHLAFAADDHGMHELREEVCRRTARHLKTILSNGTFFKVLSILQMNKVPDHHFHYGMKILKHLEKLGHLVISLRDAERLTNELSGLYFNDTRDPINDLSHVR